jgi:catechol 2,3-dioxygenase-like lactoylglutathione lyase family enzyme
MNRRELLGMFGASVFALRSFAAQADEPQFAGLDRIEFYVSNVEKSRDFYVRVFGNTLKKRNEKRYIKLGSSYMAFEPPRGNTGQIRVDHYSVSIKNLEMPKLHAFLDQRGVAYQDYPSGRDTGVTDPEGIRTQLSPENGWRFINTPNFPDETVAIPDEPIFRPSGLDIVLVNVSDPEKSLAFYQRFLGQPVDHTKNRIWFQVGNARAGLQQIPQGESTGVHFFSVAAAQFESGTVIQKLREAGAMAVSASDEVPGAVAFRDPDGFRILVVARTS